MNNDLKKWMELLITGLYLINPKLGFRKLYVYSFLNIYIGEDTHEKVTSIIIVHSQI